MKEMIRPKLELVSQWSDSPHN